MAFTRRPRYLLFGSEKDIENYTIDKNVEDFEDEYTTLIVQNEANWMRSLELLRKYGDYCYLDEGEYDRIV